MMLWKAQQQAKKDAKKNSSSNNENDNGDNADGENNDSGSGSCTKSNGEASAGARNFSKVLMDANQAAEAERVDISSSKIGSSFYWSEAMDVKLAKHVHASVFDFAKVSEALKELCTDEDLGGVDAKLITEESCRNRWCELDVDDNDDAGGAPVSTSKPNIVVSADGQQLSFAELQRQVNMQPSSHLKIPANLPNVGDEDEGEGDEEGDEIVNAAALRAKFSTNFEALD